MTEIAAGSQLKAHATRVPSTSVGWIVSPWFDLFFFANVLWLLAFIPSYLSADGKPYIEFWQVHFIAAPHRWITHFLVVMDPDRRGGRSTAFIVLAVALAALIGGVQFATGSLAALGLAYHAWNGWHFAAQHSGILRIYALKAGGGRRWLDTYAMRVLVVYAAARVIPGFDRFVNLLWLDVQWLDWIMLACPVMLVIFELTDSGFRLRPKFSYLASVCMLYSSLILAAHLQQPMLILSLVSAATIFHSLEYFAIVSHYAWRRQSHGSPGLFQFLARRWTLVVVWFIVTCGILFSTLDRMFVNAWFAVNLWASFLHFAYDGLIWKLRRPATAAALDAQSAAPEVN